ncbi:MAG TPA: hypothetical protein VME46_23285, partial [Acidimicrobiales bacterium]|nr:hypothetical protein [Acidimicrobiales bacterium]
TPAMVPYLAPYAGQMMTTGAQAEAYANHFIAIHLQEMTGGKTYSQESTYAMSLKPGTPQYTAAQSLVDTVFKGTTLRSMLLNAYGWWRIGQVALVSSILSFVFGGLTLVLSGLGLWHARRVPAEEEIPYLKAVLPSSASDTATGKLAPEIS